MFRNLNSKSVSICLKSILFILIFNLVLSFAENPNSVSTELNITVTSSSDKSVSITAPKLLGIFADGVNDSTTVLNSNKFNVDIDISNQVQNKTKITNRKIIPVQEIVKNTYAVPQLEANTSHSSLEYLDNALGPAVEPTEANEVPQLNPCKKLTFLTTNDGNESESQVSPQCVLGSASEALYFSESISYGVPFAATGQVKYYVEYYYYKIPEEGFEEIDLRSYIAIMVDICSESKGQVLIIDERSNQQLLSFNNMGTTRICNHWETDFESFVSDSDKVRIELAIPSDQQNPGKPNTEFTFLGENNLKGTRQIWNRYFNMSIVYFEIKFNNNTIEELDPTDLEREALYQPNSVFTYKLMPSQTNTRRETKIGLEIELNYLDIDIDAGDFVLVGPGSEPSNRELSNAQIIAENIAEEDPSKSIWVNADSAYIRLVTHNSDKKTGTALKFSWTPPNNTLPDVNEEKVSDRIRNSAIQICLMGSMCQQFDNAIEERFKDEMTDITNDFLFNKNDNKEEDETKKLVSAKSVFIFGMEDGIYGQQETKNNIYCQMNLAITSAFNEQWPLVSHNTLQYIFFRGSDHRYMHSSGTVKFTDCSHEPISFLKMILPIIVILIVSIVLLFIAWRYQYRNWTHLQRTQNTQKYMNARVGDPNEDELYARENPIFEDDEGNFQSKGRSSTNRIDSVDGRPTSEHKPLSVQLSHASSTSSRKLPSVKESPEFVKNLWTDPGTSRQQNEYVFDDIQISADDKSDGNHSPSHKTRDNLSKANTYSKSSGDTLTAQLPITGLNGTQHESLRSYPRSALRRLTIVAENEIPLGPDGQPIRRSSKVQFELPIKSNKLMNNNNSVEETNESNNDLY